MCAQPSNDLAGNKRERPLRGEFKLKLHGGKNVQISSEAHKKIKKSEVTEKNKHASIREMEKFVKRTLQSLAGGRGGGDDGQWPWGQAAGLPCGVWKREIGPASMSPNSGCCRPSCPLLRRAVPTGTQRDGESGGAGQEPSLGSEGGAGCRRRGHSKSPVLEGRQGLDHVLTGSSTGRGGRVWVLFREHLESL